MMASLGLVMAACVGLGASSTGNCSTEPEGDTPSNAAEVAIHSTIITGSVAEKEMAVERDDGARAEVRVAVIEAGAITSREFVVTVVHTDRPNEHGCHWSVARVREVPAGERQLLQDAARE